MTKIISAGIPSALSTSKNEKTDFSQLLKSAAQGQVSSVAKTTATGRATTTVVTRKAFLLDELVSHAQNGKGLPTLDLGDLPERANDKSDALGTTAPEVVLINGDGAGMDNFVHERVDNLIFIHEDLFNDWATGLDGEQLPNILENFLLDYTRMEH